MEGHEQYFYHLQHSWLLYELPASLSTKPCILHTAYIYVFSMTRNEQGLIFFASNYMKKQRFPFYLQIYFFNNYFYQFQVLLLSQFSSTFFSIRPSQNTLHCVL
jgi:hypothetical protein